MSYIENYAAPHLIVAEAPVDARASFIRRTYLHLAGAILAFVGIEYALLQSSLAEGLVQSMVGSQYGWLMVLGMFMFVGWVADRWAKHWNCTWRYPEGSSIAGLGKILS